MRSKRRHAARGISIYCRRHGCSILRRVKHPPATDVILRWFLAGQSVPRGRPSALQARHEELSPRH
eukprot:13020328-Alexandrium_andersonii.AAC.1